MSPLHRADSPSAPIPSTRSGRSCRHTTACCRSPARCDHRPGCTSPHTPIDLTQALGERNVAMLHARFIVLVPVRDDVGDLPVSLDPEGIEDADAQLVLHPHLRSRRVRTRCRCASLGAGRGRLIQQLLIEDHRRRCRMPHRCDVRDGRGAGSRRDAQVGRRSRVARLTRRPALRRVHQRDDPAERRIARARSRADARSSVAPMVALKATGGGCLPVRGPCAICRHPGGVQPDRPLRGRPAGPVLRHSDKCRILGFALSERVDRVLGGGPSAPVRRSATGRRCCRFWIGFGQSPWCRRRQRGRVQRAPGRPWRNDIYHARHQHATRSKLTMAPVTPGYFETMQIPLPRRAGLRSHAI